MQVYGKYRNINICTVVVAATLLVLCSIALFSRVQKLKTDKDWDLLIFTQHWPNTVCLLWEEQNEDIPQTCSFPKQRDIWTIHGVWPTKYGTKGPEFCNSSYHFNSSQLEPIENDLKEYWIDVERRHQRYAFWRHEWRKHGTCASVLPELSTELEYFSQGLQWAEDYNMKDILSKGGIKPGNDAAYDVSVIWDTVRQVIGANPAVQCARDRKTGEMYIFEIRICFSKSLSLADCDGIKETRGGRNFWSSNVITNCPLGTPILYPSTVPSPNRKPPPPEPDHEIVSIYKIIQFMEWITS